MRAMELGLGLRRYIINTDASNCGRHNHVDFWL